VSYGATVDVSQVTGNVDFTGGAGADTLEMGAQFGGGSGEIRDREASEICSARQFDDEVLSGLVAGDAVLVDD
jgi:hypothetical protein